MFFEQRTSAAAPARGLCTYHMQPHVAQYAKIAPRTALCGTRQNEQTEMHHSFDWNSCTFEEIEYKVRCMDVTFCIARRALYARRRRFSSAGRSPIVPPG
ncbi:hypothetical protein EVAR_64062_1 [Eumeta japonica]|uniref:Uncharacterized protein n=1 Tax=Eumeta variegata TaxID=151549 RepID=A0A4C1ZXP2_EUMVA|nr:hypothetical protein EVAR_64062_1 [Eumeta japonica]